jgi:hypothetical protein
MFGQGAHYVEPSKVLAAGSYVATVSNIEEQTENGFAMMKVKLSVNGYAGYQPDTFTLFDVDRTAAEKMQEWASKKISRFCDATGAFISEDGLHTQPAIGKKVIAVVDRKDSGFMDIIRLEKFEPEKKPVGSTVAPDVQEAQPDIF